MRKTHIRRKRAENEAAVPSIMVPVLQDRTRSRSPQFCTSLSTQTECHIAGALSAMSALMDYHIVPKDKNGKFLPPSVYLHQESSMVEVILSKSEELPVPLGTAICTSVEAESQPLFDRVTMLLRVWTVRRSRANLRRLLWRKE